MELTISVFHIFWTVQRKYKLQLSFFILSHKKQLNRSISIIATTSSLVAQLLRMTLILMRPSIIYVKVLKKVELTQS